MAEEKPKYFTIIPPGYYEVAFVHSQEGNLHPGVATCGFRYQGFDFEQDAHDLSDAWATEMMDVVTDDWKHEKTTFKEQAGIVLEQASGQTGQLAKLASPANCTYLMRKLTGKPGRRNRGRMYVPGVPDSDVDATGKLSDSSKTALQSALNSFNAKVSANKFEYYILHRALKGTDPSLFPPTKVTDVHFSGYIATQRLRMPRGL